MCWQWQISLSLKSLNDNQDLAVCRDRLINAEHVLRAKGRIESERCLEDTRGTVSPDYSKQQGFPLLGIFKVVLSLLSV